MRAAGRLTWGALANGSEPLQRFLFPTWSNKLPRLALAGAGALATAVVLGAWYWATDKHLSVGYEPVQPVEYSHKLHAGDLGLDCRYCHFTVERSSFAAVPPTQVCMNCHARVRADSPKLLPVRESWATGALIPWKRVHKLPEFAYFDHGAHLAAGVGCSTCHGRVDQMARVAQTLPLSMGWCLECHRDPKPFLREAKDLTTMAFAPPARLEPGPALAPTGRAVEPPVHCSGCHR